MAAVDLIHETLRMSKLIGAPVGDVWQFYAETSARAQWSVPEGDGLVYQFDDFRTGGRAVYLCGPAENLNFRASVEYLLVQPEQLVVYTETLRSGDQLLTSALLTWQFQPAPQGTTITVTNQLASFVGQDMIEGNRTGHRIALEQLATVLTNPTKS